MMTVSGASHDLISNTVVIIDLLLDEDGFWEEVSDHTPEARIAAHKRMQEGRNKKVRKPG